jgi:hypothetical protein
VGPDCYTSNVSPVYVNFTPSAANTDVLTLGAGYIISNESQRNPLWSATIQKNITYMVNYTNTTPVAAIYQLQGGADQDWIILQISLISSYCVQVSNGDGSIIYDPYIRTVNGPQRLLDFDSYNMNLNCGTNIVQSNSKYLEIYLTGEDDCLVGVQFLTGAYLTTSLALDIVNFTENIGIQSFPGLLAQAININSGRIIIYSYTSGSTVIQYVITANSSLSSSDQLSELSNVTQTLVNISNSGSFQVGGKPVLYNSYMISSSDASGVQVINSTVVVPTNSSGNSSNNTDNGGGNTTGGSTFFQKYGVLIILVSIFLLIGIFAAGYFWYQKRLALQRVRAESTSGFDVEVVKPKKTHNASEDESTNETNVRI